MRRSWIAACTVVLAMLLGGGSASAGTVPSGFQDTIVYSGLVQPTALAFAPDGRVFVAEQSGLIKVFDGLGDTTPTIFADLRTEVHSFADRGLLGLAVDPQFPTRPYVYALYSRDALLGGGPPPQWGEPGESFDSCPDTTEDDCGGSGALSRLTASGDVMSDKTDLLIDWCQQYPVHSVDDLEFGSDGSLYVSGGDGASSSFADWGQSGIPVHNPCGDPPGGVGTGLTPPTAEGGALRSQDARTTGDPTGLNGALLRISPDTGEGMPGNPFFGSTDANQRRIVALGFRNPYRIAFRPGTEELWVGDVGWNSYEEVDRIVDATDASAENFGWPCYEGPQRQPSFDSADLSLCESLYSGGGTTSSHFAYFRNHKLVEGEPCPTGSSAISGLDFYEGGQFPDAYDGALFVADYARSCIWAMLPGADGLPDPDDIQTFDVGAVPIDLVVHQGQLFYVDVFSGEVRRVSHPEGSAPPTAVATATPAYGPAPLTVQLSAAGSSDPNGDTPLSYAWDLDEDGEFDDSTAITLSHTYTEPDIHNPAVKVTEPGGAFGMDSVEIQAGNTPPIAEIEDPEPGTQWAVGDPIEFEGAAIDAEQSSLPDSAFDWRILIEHCPSNCHEHIHLQRVDQPESSFTAPDHESPAHLRLELKVTDEGGLSDTATLDLHPRTVGLTLDSSPSGLQLVVGPEQGTAPFTRQVIEGSQNSVSAPGSQTLGGQTYAFQSWSDGGAASHNLVVSADQTLTATYTPVLIPPGLAPVRGKVGGKKKCKKKRGKRPVAAKKCKKPVKAKR